MSDFFTDITFGIAYVLIVLSVFLFSREYKNTAVFFLSIGVFFLGFFMIQLDPFLNIWDEQFHALVAKNMMEQPLKPMLIKEPLFGYMLESWSTSHVWMHKQPFFLWQIALSMELFGVNEIGVRVPSVVMHALIVIFVYRTGKLMYSSTLGFYTALFYGCAYFPLEYLTGFYATDHNDTAFAFYCFSSIWSLTEYLHSGKKRYLLLIGLFSGISILCKWLTGLVVYAIWTLILFFGGKKISLKACIPLALSLLVCIITFLPWQIYASIQFPAEYESAMNFNSRHITEALEGHGGTWTFYYTALYEEFGEGLLIPPLVLISYVLFVIKIPVRKFKIVAFSIVSIILLFFTLVKTKMPGYVLVTVPFLMMGPAWIIAQYSEWIKQRKIKPAIQQIFIGMTVLVIAFLLLNQVKIYKHHGDSERAKFRNRKILEKGLYLNIKSKYKSQKYALFNCRSSQNAHIAAEFYTDLPSFGYLSSAQILRARSIGYQLIAIDDGFLPPEIVNDPFITKVKFNP